MQFLSAEEQEVGRGAIFQETYDRVDRKMKEYDARLNLGVICGALGLSYGVPYGAPEGALYRNLYGSLYANLYGNLYGKINQNLNSDADT